METLAERIAREGPLGPEDAVGWAVRLAKHLESLHVHGVAHGSVSPACIASEGPLPSDRGVILDVRKMVSNVAFHSPERVRSGQISPQDDAWALGCTLYTLVTGTMPFQGANEPEIRDRILAGSAPPLAVYGVDDENLQRIVGGGIAREPSHRYASLAQMRSDLERWAPSSVGLEPLEDEGDADEDQAATTMLPMHEAFRAVAAFRPPPAAAPPAPRPAAPPPSIPRPVAAPPALAPPPRPAPPVAPPPPLADEASGGALYEEPDVEDEPRQEQDDTVMRELPAHIMALAARSAAGSTPPPPKPDGPISNLHVPRPPAPPHLDPAGRPQPSMPIAPVAFGAPPTSARLDPARPAAAAPARPPAPPAPPSRPGGTPDPDEDDVRTVYAVHTAAELAELERKGPAAPLAAPPPPAPLGVPMAAPPLAAPPQVPVANDDDDYDDDDAARTVIRDPGPLPSGMGMPPRAGPPAPPPPAAGRTFKSTQLGMGAVTNPNAAPPPMGAGPNAWSPAAAPGGVRPHAPGGQLAEVPLGQQSAIPQPTPSSGVRLGAPDAPGGADVSALIQDALGFEVPGSTDPMRGVGSPQESVNDPSMGGGGFPPAAGFGSNPNPNPNVYGDSQGQGAFPGQGPQGFGGPPGQAFGGPAGFPPQQGGPGYPGGQGGQPGPFGAGGEQAGFQPGGFPGSPGQNMGGSNYGPPGAPGPGMPGGPFGQEPFPGAYGDPNALGAPASAGGPGSQGAQIPAHLLAPPGQLAGGTTSSMRTWYVVCVLAMMLVAAVTFIALRFMSG